MRKKRPPSAVRRNPEKASWDGFADEVRRVDVLARGAAKVVDRHSDLDVPEIMGYSARLLASTTKAAKEFVRAQAPEMLAKHHSMRSLLEESFEAARAIHKRSAELRKSEEWIVWSALKPHSEQEWRMASNDSHGAAWHANRAVVWTSQEEWTDAMTEVTSVSQYAGSVLIDLGYGNAGTEIKRWAHQLRMAT